MGKCLFCGAVVYWRHDKENMNFDCETALRGGDIWLRGNPCYEAQLAAQADLIRRAVEVVGASLRIASDEGDDLIARETAIVVWKRTTQTLLPDLQKALEKAK